jgi:predicted GNAT family N-acyltransferase
MREKCRGADVGRWELTMLSGHRQISPNTSEHDGDLDVACEIRVLDALDELLDSYRLRDEVYGGLGYTRRYPSGFEIDAYDPFAIPFGAFDAKSGELIGLLRLITNRPQAGYIQALCQLLARTGDKQLLESISKPPDHPLPSIISGRVVQSLAQYNREQLPVQELSRTIVRSEYRGSGVSRGLMEFGLAYASRQGPVVLIGGCLEEHVPMYERYGYERLTQTDLDFFESVGRAAVAVACHTDRLPEPTRTHVDLLRPKLRAAALRRLRQAPLPAVYRLAREGERLRPIEGS